MDELLIVTTGGTIDKVYFDDKSDYQVGEPQIGRILQELGVAFRFTVIPIIRKPSSAAFTMGISWIGKSSFIPIPWVLTATCWSHRRLRLSSERAGLPILNTTPRISSFGRSMRKVESSISAMTPTVTALPSGIPSAISRLGSMLACACKSPQRLLNGEVIIVNGFAMRK